MPSTEGRLIDKEKGTRTRPMKVLVLGAARTGTTSIYTALNRLGFRTYHMAEIVKDPPRIIPLWVEALKAKYLGIGKPWGLEEFDKILGDFDGVADVPCANFADELIALYPDAKVILTNRDIDKWLVSSKATVLESFRWASWKWVAPADPYLAKPLYSLATLMLGAFAGRPEYDPTKYHSPEFLGLMRQGYLDHYAHVRAITPKDNLLEFKSEDGWEPLCKFLDVPVPEGPYPRVNDTANFVRMHKVIWWMAFGKFLAKRALPVAVAAGAAAYFYWQQRAKVI